MRGQQILLVDRFQRHQGHLYPLSLPGFGTSPHFFISLVDSFLGRSRIKIRITTIRMVHTTARDCLFAAEDDWKIIIVHRLELMLFSMDLK